ncbi:hypothetical protein NIES592_19430 [Fischerella major NIES-592]|uniref:Uncharacterized protein n=2 Tax=Fischerella TaxID=1190 RepID=A0A1U7GVF7_9CYAN|nr:hypothetical protein [Fischerella major]OKH12095.1 hypothetical protein NIES592_19430 [Fischerella major NIES-592]
MSRDALVVGIHTYSYERLNNLTAPYRMWKQYQNFCQNMAILMLVKRLPAVKFKQNNTIRVGQKTGVTLTQLEEAIAFGLGWFESVIA